MAKIPVAKHAGSSPIKTQASLYNAYAVKVSQTTSNIAMTVKLAPKTLNNAAFRK